MQREPWASHKAACDAAEQGGAQLGADAEAAHAYRTARLQLCNAEPAMRMQRCMRQLGCCATLAGRSLARARVLHRRGGSTRIRRGGEGTIRWRTPAASYCVPLPNTGPAPKCCFGRVKAALNRTAPAAFVVVRRTARATRSPAAALKPVARARRAGGRSRSARAAHGLRGEWPCASRSWRRSGGSASRCGHERRRLQSVCCAAIWSATHHAVCGRAHAAHRFCRMWCVPPESDVAACLRADASA